MLSESDFSHPAAWLVLTISLLTACTQPPSQREADVIVVGAGIAGLSAALEASDQGAKVLVVEANSVGGGHAVIAGGFALVDTELQRQKGIEDSPDIAFEDLMAWGETADPYWARRYAEESGPDVYNWLVQFGIRFFVIIDTPEDTVPRFHFTRGTAVNVVVPLMRAALRDPNIEFVWNTRVTALIRQRGAIRGVLGTNERDASRRLYKSTSVILATGGFQNNLDRVRNNWPADRPLPGNLLKGAGQYAKGDGYTLAAWAGADLRKMDRQVTFYNGVPDPRDATGTTALTAENPAAIWIAATGRRFVNEAADGKVTARAIQQLEPAGYWMLFDGNGSRRLGLRGAPWINRDTVRSEILDNPLLTAKADTLEQLADTTGISEHGLRTTVETWNRMVDAGADFQFDRFDKANKPRGIQALLKPPYYALKMYPLTRKSMGGPAIDNAGRVLAANEVPVPGLYAAGELTGVAGINGSHGGAGTFLGPSVLTGRIAGHAAAADIPPETTRSIGFRADPRPFRPVPAQPGQPGYWHFDVAHELVRERGYSCTDCHDKQKPMQMAETQLAMLARLNTCTQCH